MLLIDLLPMVRVKLVIDYFIDINLYPIIASTHNWLLIDEPEIAVDGARLYVMIKSEGLKSLNHSLANVKDDERRLIEFGDSQQFDYLWSGSSHDGR